MVALEPSRPGLSEHMIHVMIAFGIPSSWSVRAVNFEFRPPGGSVILSNLRYPLPFGSDRLTEDTILNP